MPNTLDQQAPRCILLARERKAQPSPCSRRGRSGAMLPRCDLGSPFCQGSRTLLSVGPRHVQSSLRKTNICEIISTFEGKLFASEPAFLPRQETQPGAHYSAPRWTVSLWNSTYSL